METFVARAIYKYKSEGGGGGGGGAQKDTKEEVNEVNIILNYSKLV